MKLSVKCNDSIHYVGALYMIRWFIALMIPVILLTSCDSSEHEEVDILDSEIQDDQKNSDENHIEERVTQDSKIGESNIDMEKEIVVNDSDREQTAGMIEDKDTSTFIKTPEDAIYEALVLTHSGVTVYKEPNHNSENIGIFNFGDHVFALLEVENWTYVSGRDIEGWVPHSDIIEIPYDSSIKKEVKNPTDILVLVNKQYRLPRDYKPQNLVIPDVSFTTSGTPEKKYMREDAAQALEEMFAASKEDGIELFALSGYRSFSTQEQLFPTYVLREGFTWANQFSAFPGESEHQTGLAMDITSREVDFTLTEDFGETKEGLWLEEKAYKFGFIIRYPKEKEDITGYTYEPWHLRYVGNEAAKEIYDMNITLEEYLE
jgi:LAS superfamily LD-carboxypeptidase LdcB